MDILSLTVLGRNIQVQCQNSETYALLVAYYGHMQGQLAVADMVYTVGKSQGSRVFFVEREGQAPLVAADAGEFLFLFEKDLSIELQKLRCDLYFLHSAALVFAETAYLLVGPSGSGKSTTTWALLHHGYSYASDELGVVHLSTLEIFPYPRALCLKKAPPSAYPLPETALTTSNAFYIPVAALPARAVSTLTPLRAIFFIQYSPETTRPSVQSISRAEAGARLFANALNPLAHPGEGLDGAVAIATQCACFTLCTAEPSATCAVVTSTLHTRLSR